jgi:sulfite reductase alpha subunit-like flavoprotein
MKFGLPQIANGKLFFIGLAAVLGPWSLYLFTLNRAAKRLKEAERDNEIVKEKAIVEDTTETSPTKSSTSEKEDKRRKILIIYGTCTGTARRLALDLSKKFGSVFSADDVAITVVDAKDYDEFTLDLEDIVLFICSTWTGETT